MPGATIEAFLPVVGKGSAATMQRRAALASTLIGGLELSCDGAAMLDQDGPSVDCCAPRGRRWHIGRAARSHMTETVPALGQGRQTVWRMQTASLG